LLCAVAIGADWIGFCRLNVLVQTQLFQNLQIPFSGGV
jgi:hypothetical protein